MDPKNYTEEMLDRRFALVLAKKTNSDYGRVEYYRPKGEKHWSGLPEVFTLRGARDKFYLSKSACEKLRRTKVGKRRQMNSGDIERLHNLWFVLRLDPEVEKAIESKEAELDRLRAEIKKVASDLMKAEQAVQNELEELEAQGLGYGKLRDLE